MVKKMQKKKMKFTHEIVIDGEKEVTVRDVNVETLNTGEIVYDYIENNHNFLMKFSFHDEGLLVKIYGDDYVALIPLELNQKTSGKYIIRQQEVVFDFFLRQIEVKSLAIYLEYDIFTRGSVISNNTWRIEVK